MRIKEQVGEKRSTVCTHRYPDCVEKHNFLILNLPFTSICNIPAAPAYGVYISQLIRYSRACGSYQDFIDRGLLLTRKLLNQGFLLVKLKSWLRKLYGRHHDLRDNQNPYIEEEQTTQWSKEKVQKDKQRSTKHTYKTKDRATRTPLKTGDKPKYLYIRGR
jgi:hypothetical protein